MKSKTRNLLFILAVVIALLVFLLLATPARAASYTASVTGDWSNPATWGGSGPPTALDTVTINSGVIVTIDVPAECASITINAPAVANGITISGNNTLTVTGAITMNAPTAGVTSTIAVDTGTLNAGSIAIPGSATAGRFCTVSVSTGTINVTGSITFSGTATQARLIFTDAGTLNIGGNLGAGGTFTASSGTVNCNGTVAQTVAGYTYYTLKSNNPAGVTLLANATITTLTIGDITPNSVFNDGGRTITLGAGSVLNMLNGAIYNLGSATVGTTWRAWVTTNMATGTTVGYISDVAQTVSATPTYQNLILSGAGAKTITSMTVRENFTSSGGTITMTAVRTITLGGNFSNSSALSHDNRLSLTLNGAGDQAVTNAISPLTLSTFTVNKASGTAFPGVNLAINANLTITTGTLDLSTFTADRTAAGGTMTVAAGATLRIGGTNTLPANYTTYTFGTPSTIEYYGGDQLIGARTHRNLILSGSGTKTLQAGTTTISNNLTLRGTVSTTTVVGLTIGGNLDVGDGTTFNVAGFALTVTGTTTVGGGTSGNLIISAAAGTKTFVGRVTVNANGTWNNSGNSAVVFRGGITNSGTFNAGAGVHTFNTNAQELNGTFSIPSVTVTGVTLTNNGALTVTTALAGTGGLTNAATGTLNIGFTGPPAITTLTAIADGNNVNYNRAGAQTVKATTYFNLTLSGSDAKTFPAGTTVVNGILSREGTATATITGTLNYGADATLQYKGSAAQTTGAEFPATFEGSGGVIINNSNGINLGSSKTIASTLTLINGTFAVGANTLTLNGPSIAGTPSNLSTTSSSSLVFGGFSTGINIPSSVTSLNNLTINNANGVTLNSSSTIYGTLTLTSGKITTGSNTIIINSSGSVSGGSSSSYVIGNLQKNVATGPTTRTFEVGGVNYNPVTLLFSNVSTAGYLTVKATPGQHPNIRSSLINSKKDVNVYWSFTNSGIVFDNYDAIFDFVSGDVLGGADTANFSVGKYNSGWSYPDVGVRTSTSTQAIGITSFSDFVLGEQGANQPAVSSSSLYTVGGETSLIDKAAVLAPLIMLPLLFIGAIVIILFRLKKHAFPSMNNLKFIKRCLAVFSILSLVMALALIPCSQPLANTNIEPRAAIIDQVSVFEPNTGFVSEISAVLESAGYKVDVWQGRAVTVDLYRQLPRYGYKIIVFRTHMSFYYLGTDTTFIKGTALFSGESYSTARYIPDQLDDTVIKANIAKDSPTVFAVNSQFITDTMEGRFDDTIVLMMGCNSYELDDMAKAFIQKGASTYVGWNGEVTLNHLDRATLNLINDIFMNHLSIETAVTQTIVTIGPDPYHNAFLRYYADKENQIMMTAAR